MNVFKENDLEDIATGKITQAMLATASQEKQEEFQKKQEEFQKKQIKIMRMIGTSVPADVLQRIRDNETGSEMWTELCDLYEGKQNEAIKAYTIRRLENELWDMKLAPGGDSNLHLCKMFNIKTELVDLQHTIADSTIADMLLESLPEQTEFESLKASIRYGADPSLYTPKRVRKLVLAAAARQKEFRGKRSGNQGGQWGGESKGGDLDKSENKQDSPKRKRRVRKCYICDSTKHLKAQCPERANKQSDADENEQKRKPRGNCTLRQEDSASSSPARRGEESLMDGVMKGVLAVEGDVEQVEQEPARDNVAEVSGAYMEVNGHDADVLATSNDRWYFDTASNSRVTGNRSHFVNFVEDTEGIRSIRDVTPSIASRIAGVGTVGFITVVDGEQVEVYLDDVFYIPGAEYGLFSPELAHKQGFQLHFDQATRNFTVSMEGVPVIVATPHEATWGFEVTPSSQGGLVRSRVLCNYTVMEGVGSLSLWHERLCHTCPQYLKTMVDKRLVQGVMLTQRHQDTCDVCHLGKQKKKARQKKLDRVTKRPNQVVYADLLIPSKSNGTRYEAVLVIIDGYSRFVTVHLLSSKASEVVNKHLKEYVLWAERQAGRNQKNGAAYSVQKILTDKGGKFVNSEMAAWYDAQGIEHVKVGPKSSQSNLCKRTHRTLVGMTKTTMSQAGFPRSLWPEALKNAVYVENRVCNKGTQGIPFEMMFGVKPDVHHIRKFGSLAYIHVPVTPGRRKHHNNAKLGFVLGYAEDVVVCKVYFPEDHTAKYVADLRVAEDVMYRDRHAVYIDKEDLSSLHFSQSGEDEDQSDVDSDMDMATMKSEQFASTVAASVYGKTNGLPSVREINGRSSVELEEGENDENAVQEEFEYNENAVFTNEDMSQADNIGGGEHLNVIDVERDVVEHECEEVESVVGTCGSTVAEWDDEPENRNDIKSDDEEEDLSDDEIAVSSVFAEDEDIAGRGETKVSSVSTLEEDHIVEKSAEGYSKNPFEEEPQQTRNRVFRDETPPEEERVERGAEKQETKKPRTGLREYRERRRPSYLDDYVMNITINNSRILDKNGRPIRASQIKVPCNRREALRSKWRDFWLMAEMGETAALKAKGVIQEIPSEEVPEDAKPVKTMWVYALKSDHFGYVIRFNADSYQ